MGLPAADPNKKPDYRTTMELGAVLPETAEVRNGHLFVGGVDMVELAHTQGTALYVYDEADMRHRMQAYVQAFQEHYPTKAGSGIIYASKAFLNKACAKLVQEEGLYLDVSGGGEFACAQAAGFDAARVFMHGNNKTEAELTEAISAGVGRIVVDSRIELARISRICEKLGVTQKIYMRITPGVEADTHEYIRTGCEDSKFGFNMRNDWAFSCVKDALETPNVELVGLHCHIGSQIFAVHSFEQAVEVMLDFIERIEREYGHTSSELDMGGGLGVAYDAEDKPTSISDFAAVVCGAVLAGCKKRNMEAPRLLVEPGRSLVASAGLTLYTVGILKTLPGIRKFVAVDGGMSDNIRTALYHANYEPTLANKADEPRDEIVTICGKHCESGDAVVIEKPLQHAEVGDIVAVFGTGAYCATMASNYNGQPRPGVVFVKDGQARLVTRRETYEDLLARDL